MLADRYHDFAQLRAGRQEGHDYRIVTVHRPSSVLVLAPHGGGIEPGTSEIAEAVAGAEYSLYRFEGIRSTGNDVLHVTSTGFDEPRCLAMLAVAMTVLAVHGCAEEEEVVWLGGRDSDLAAALTASLAQAGIVARPDISLEHGGTYANNICNRGANGRGCQMEISLGLRRALFGDVTTRSGRRNRTELNAVLVGAVRQALP